MLFYSWCKIAPLEVAVLKFCPPELILKYSRMSQSKVVTTPSDFHLRVLQTKLELPAALLLLVPEPKCSALGNTAWMLPTGLCKMLEGTVKSMWGTVSTGGSSALFSKQHNLEEMSFISLGNHVFRHEIFFEGRQILWAFILNLLALFLDMRHYWNKNIFGCMKTLFLLNDLQCTSID